MVAVSTYCAFAQRAPVPTRVRGTIEAVNGDTMQVKSRSGEDVKLRIAPDVNVSGITRISLADIKPGSFIGATTVPGPDFFTTMNLGPSPGILLAMSVMLRTISVTSSRTPAIEENSCSTPSMRKEGNSAPCRD